MRKILPASTLILSLAVLSHAILGLAILGLAGGSTSACAAQESRDIELLLERSPGPDESVEVRVATGPLPRGARLIVMDRQGRVLGAVAPFPPGSAATATVPVPRAALAGGHLPLRLQVTEPGAPPRAPRAEEVRRLEGVIVPGEQ